MRPSVISAAAVALAIAAAGVSYTLNTVGDPRYCGAAERDAKGRILRDEEVLDKFASIHPCPSTGEPSRICPGWAIDHVIPLSCGGCDSIGNLQWLPDQIKSAAGKYPKDRWERKIYYVPGITTDKSCTVEIIPYEANSK